MIKIGEMRHRVSIQQRTTLQDAAGEQVDHWNEVLNRPAALARMPGAEVWASAQRNARVPTVFRMRYENGVVPGMRLIFNDRTFDIKSVIDPSGVGEEMVLTTEELVDE